jgi:hypothetical protein
MKVRWQVKIENGKWMAGTHTFRTKGAAEAYIADWRRCEDSADASVALLRNGVPVSAMGTPIYYKGHFRGFRQG